MKLDRALGLLGILGGGILLSAFLPVALPWTPDAFNLRLVVYGIGAMAVIVGVHRRHMDSGPALAWSAAIPAFVAHATYTVLVIVAVSQPGQVGAGDYGPWFATAAMGMWLADAWFGVVIVRLGISDRWAGLALAIGSPLTLLGIDRLGLVDGPIGSIIGPIALTGVALNGLGWVLLGIDLVRQAKANRSPSSLAHGLPRP